MSSKFGALEGPFSRLARTFARTSGLNVVMSGVECRTDANGTIYLPGNADFLDDKTQHVLEGMLDQQATLVEEDAAARKSGRPTFQQVLNSCPDNKTKLLTSTFDAIRVQANRARTYAGMGDNLRDLNAFTVQQVQKAVKKGDADQWQTMSAAILARAHGLDESWVPAPVKAIIDAAGDVIAQARSARTPAEAKGLAEDFLKAVRTAIAPPPPPAPPVPAPVEEEPQTDGSTEDSEGAEGEGAEDEGAEDEGAEDEGAEDGDAGEEDEQDDFGASESMGDKEGNADSKETSPSDAKSKDKEESKPAESKTDKDDKDTEDDEEAEAGEDGGEDSADSEGDGEADSEDGAEGDADGADEGEGGAGGESEDGGEEGGSGETDESSSETQPGDGEGSEGGSEGGEEAGDSEGAEGEGAEDEGAEDGDAGEGGEAGSGDAGGDGAADGVEAGAGDAGELSSISSDSSKDVKHDAALTDMGEMDAGPVEPSEPLSSEAKDLATALLKDDAETSDVGAAAKAALRDTVRKDVKANKRYMSHPAVQACDTVNTPFSGSPARYQKELEKVRPQVSALRAKILQVLAARKERRFEGDKERGSIDGASLYSLRTGNKNVFAQRTQEVDLDTAILILVDQSGSMNSKLDVTRPVIIALAECLSKTGIPFAIWGFDNDHGGEVWEKTREYRMACPGDTTTYNRHERNVVDLYKGFNEPFSKVKGRLLSVRADGNNADGEFVLMAAKALAQRKESRKILMVLSDGQPAAMGGMEVEAAHLKHAVAATLSAGIECFGLGILTDAPKHYYPDYALVDTLDALPKAVFHMLQKYLLSGGKSQKRSAGGAR